MLTVATDSMLSCLELDGGLETKIWKATVSSEPVDDDELLVFEELVIEASTFIAPNEEWSVLVRPSLEIISPDGSIGMLEESSPLIAILRAGTSIGAYIISDPKASTKLS